MQKKTRQIFFEIKAITSSTGLNFDIESWPADLLVDYWLSKSETGMLKDMANIQASGNECRPFIEVFLNVGQ